MKLGLIALALISGSALAAPHSDEASRTPAKVLTAAAVPAAAALTLVSAAGSIMVLVDGRVAHAAMAQIDAPAPGFVYER